MKTIFKRIRPALLMVALALALAGQAWAQSTIWTASSTMSAPRVGASNYIDWWVVRAGPTKLISVFGYNGGPLQYLQFFDNPNGPVLNITAWDNVNNNFTNANHALTTGQRVQLTNTVAGITAGIYYARPYTTNAFYLYDTYAHAIATGSETGLKTVSGGSSTATMLLVPLHSMAMAASDNYSIMITGTGMGFGKGLTIANSTTPATYTTPGLSNFTATVTYTAP